MLSKLKYQLFVWNVSVELFLLNRIFTHIPNRHLRRLAPKVMGVTVCGTKSVEPYATVGGVTAKVVAERKRNRHSYFPYYHLHLV